MDVIEQCVRKLCRVLDVLSVPADGGRVVREPTEEEIAEACMLICEVQDHLAALHDVFEPLSRHFELSENS